MTPIPMPLTEARINASIVNLVEWIDVHRYQGYDPADGNESPLRRLALGYAFPQRLLQQGVLRCPVNIRPLLGIRPLESTKGRGYIAWGCLELFRQTGDPRMRARAVNCLEWLMRHRSPRYADYCWGNDFPYATRAGQLPRHEPTIVWSSLIGEAFLSGYELLKDPRYRHVATSVGRWIVGLPREESPAGGCCLSYVALRQRSVHNANLLGAAFLAHLTSHTHDPAASDLARRAVHYSCSRQNPDGSWAYGPGPEFPWIDNFHTGYNLDSLRRYQAYSGDTTFDAPLRLGYAFFKRHFFMPDGRAKYYHDKLYPIDIQSCAQAIETFAHMAERDVEALVWAQRVASWTIANMQMKDGHFCYRMLPHMRVTTPMIHWGQGTMLNALAALSGALLARRAPRVEAPPCAAVPVCETAALADVGPGEPAGHNLAYVLITPAHNEAARIEATLQAVERQTIRPLRWIIVSDGSTDGTDAIVQRHAAREPWIELIRMPPHAGRDFAAKAHCVRAAYDRLREVPFDIVANLDADITFEEDYFAFLLRKFEENPVLGVGGTPFVENGRQYDYRYATPEYVSGPCQLFRRACYDAVGGYRPIATGAIDWVAVTMARMQGWQTRTFMEKVCVHHRAMGTGDVGVWRARFRQGRKDYAVGNHPFWEVLRCGYHGRRSPVAVGSVLMLAGYLWSGITRAASQVPPELRAFQRRDQAARLRQGFRLSRFVDWTPREAAAVVARTPS